MRPPLSQWSQLLDVPYISFQNQNFSVMHSKFFKTFPKYKFPKYHRVMFKNRLKNVSVKICEFFEKIIKTFPEI